MKKYCSVEDVLSVAIDFRSDVWPEESAPAGINRKENTQTIPKADVEFIISEASEMVRARLKPNYASAVIDAYVITPPVVIYLTKTYAAILMFERYSSQNMDRNDKLIEELNRSMKDYDQIIINGAITDADGELVTRLTDPDILLGRDNDDYKAFDELGDLYENGRFY